MDDYKKRRIKFIRNATKKRTRWDFIYIILFLAGFIIGQGAFFNAHLDRDIERMVAGDREPAVTVTQPWDYER